MHVVDMKINAPDEFIDKKHLTVFTRGCNMICDYCFNKHINQGCNYSFSEIMVKDLIESNSQVIDYILFTGGEPTLQSDLYQYIEMAKNLGYYVEVCSNGVLPHKIEDIMYYVDKFRIDFKAGYEYRHLFYNEQQWQGLDSTIRLLKDQDDTEYRAVLHKDTTMEYLYDLLETAWLAGVRNFSLIHDINHTIEFDYKTITESYFPTFKEYRTKEESVVV